MQISVAIYSVRFDVKSTWFDSLLCHFALFHSTAYPRWWDAFRDRQTKSLPNIRCSRNGSLDNDDTDESLLLLSLHKRNQQIRHRSHTPIFLFSLSVVDRKSVRIYCAQPRSSVAQQSVLGLFRVPTGPYFREKSLFSIVALPALEKSLLLNIFDRSPGKVLIFNRCVKTWMINIVLRKLRFSKCCGNDVELFGNPSDPLTNHRWRVVWRHLVPAKIPRASFIKFYYVVTLSQSADTWCHVVVVRNLIGPQSRRYTWHTLRKTSSIFVEIRQHT